MASSASASAPSYKQLKEDFVSNLTGSSSLDVSLVLVGGHVAALLWCSLQARQSFFKAYTPLAFVVDFLVNIAVLLLSVTLYSGNPLFLNLLLLGAAAVVYALPPSLGAPRRRPQRPKPSSAGPTKPTAPPYSSSAAALGVLSVKPFLTVYRANMIIMTCICILAVDFRLFPRRFAKVETWGTSLMDLGVGSFVYSAGVVASRPALKERAAGGRPTPLATRLWGSMRHSIPLLVLGLVRLLSVKGLDYAEHVTEYGVHWNFFFTLGFLPPFVALFQSAIRIIPSYAALAILIAVLYQVLIESTPLKAYILMAPRTGLISMNREGIFSFIGYLAIFLAGQDAGMFLLPRRINQRSNSGAGVQRTTLVLTLAVWALVWSALYILCTDFKYGAGLDVARRMANLPYVLWVVAANTWLLFGFCLIETIFFPAVYKAQDARSEREAYKAATSRIMNAFNRNGLAIFLVANLLTGLVNMTVPTLHAGQIMTVTILLGYMATLAAVAVGLDMLGISIKL